MSRIVRYDPFRELRRIMWSGFPLMDDDLMTHGSSSLLSVDAYEEDQYVVVKADIPGVKPDDVDISVSSDSVTIKANRNEEKEIKNREYIRKERYSGSVARTLSLPSPVIPDEAEATFIDGSLTLRIKKQLHNPSKQVQIKVNSETNGH
ncbi:Hsp20/alpha crystallin family protein [candidate division WWE3 bacterium]|nr:Hsp20/alpha crystallin family protein [candidate division WWE3 bacterium]